MGFNFLIRTIKELRHFKKLFLTMFITLMISTSLFPQEIYHGCGMEGTARSKRVKALNELKNRYNFPGQKDFDKNVSLNAMLQQGDDTHRWDPNKAAEVIGYVFDVKPGGIESCNCEAKDKLYRDTHIELVLDPNGTAENKRVIVEVTPRIRAIMKEKGIDWTTQGLRKAFLGRWVKVQGWLLFDEEHEKQSENTNPGNPKNWRSTAWEIHPVTYIEVVYKH